MAYWKPGTLIQAMELIKNRIMVKMRAKGQHLDLEGER